jgi:hypothetical protein
MPAASELVTTQAAAGCSQDGCPGCESCHNPSHDHSRPAAIPAGSDRSGDRQSDSGLSRSTGDYVQALALNQEVVDWDTRQGATLSLSVNRFLRGKILNLMGQFAAAIGEFTQAQCAIGRFRFVRCEERRA